MREYDTINSATVQRIFDVDVYQARDILRDFVGREILVRISEQSRGPKVKYGPGPQFPERRPAERVGRAFRPADQAVGPTIARTRSPNALRTVVGVERCSRVR